MMETRSVGKTYDENVELGIAPAVSPPKSTTFLEHKVSPGYRQYVQTKDSRHLPSEPFGSQIKFEQSEGQNRYLSTKNLPIQGPPNWTQIWPEWDSIGADYSQQFSETQPMTRNQWKELQKMDEQLKNIEFTGFLGRGGYGQVWLVVAGREGSGTKTTEMACKVMKLKRRDQISLEEGVHAMLADMKVLQRLNHNNIVKYIDVIGIPDRITKFPYSVVLMLMEKCEGDMYHMLEHIGRITNDPTMDENYCIVWFRQIAQALAYLHRQNVVHMDIKPENIYYRYNDRAMKSKAFEFKDIFAMTFKLGDFGLCIAYGPGEEPTTTHCTRYTPVYVAPEIIDSAVPVLTKPNDIHCLGVTLADVLLGRAFLDHNRYISDAMEYLLQNNLTDQIRMSRDVASLMYQMTCPDPNERITAENLLQNKWLN